MNTSNKKYFIITSGATGSGKTALIKKTKEYLNIPEGEVFINILIDDLVENDPKYKEKVYKIIQNVHFSCKWKDECEMKQYQTPGSRLMKDFETAYYSSRNDPGCLQVTDKSCDDLNNDKLTNAVNKGNNIIFEFTGSYIPLWLLNTKKLPEDYYVVFSYSIVNLNNLVQRNKSRAFASIEDFELNPNKPAPRFPDVSRDKITRVVRKIREVLIDLYNSCILPPENARNKENCGDRKIDRLILFDNNGSGLSEIFDSDIDRQISKEDFISLINPSFGDGFDGGRKINKKKNKSLRTKRKFRKSKKSKKLRR